MFGHDKFVTIIPIEVKIITNSMQFIPTKLVEKINNHIFFSFEHFRWKINLVFEIREPQLHNISIKFSLYKTSSIPKLHTFMKFTHTHNHSILMRMIISFNVLINLGDASLSSHNCYHLCSKSTSFALVHPLLDWQHPFVSEIGFEPEVPLYLNSNCWVSETLLLNDINSECEGGEDTPILPF